MKSVGIKALKDKLSAYLRLVREGETVLVTDRDEVIAEIRRPSRTLSPNMSRLEQYLYQASSAGTIQMSNSSKIFPASSKDLFAPPLPISVQELLEDARSDRF